MAEIRSLGYRTDLFFPQFDGELLDRGAYLVIRTPSNPHFYWGNFLLFAQPPGAGDLERWRALFQQEIGDHQPAHHITFGWDSPEGIHGQVEPFLAAGFQLTESVILTADRVQPPPKYCREVVVRPLREDWEWQQALENQIACRDQIHALESYTPFKERQMARYQAMVRAGLGAWFGAFLDGRLVADLGLYVQDGLGRFQTVGTHPDYRRRGICGTLVFEAASYGLRQLGASTLVMAADEHYHAAKIYESLGFGPTERQIGLEWWEGLVES